MEEKGIKTYFELTTYYRKKQKEIFRNVIKSNKTIVYWDATVQMHSDSDDILQFVNGF